MSIYLKKIRKPAEPVGLARIVGNITAMLNKTPGGVSGDATRAGLAMEGIREEQASALSSALTNLEMGLESVAKDMGPGMEIKLTSAQRDAAATAGLMTGDIRSFLAAPTKHDNVSMEGMVMVTPVGIADAFSKRSFGLEAYDEKDNKNAAVYSIAYNMQSARQDEFGETLFPTIVITPDTVGYSVSIRLIQVYNDLHRSITGALDQFQKRNIIRAMIDPTILKNDQTRIIPVWRSAQSEDKFVADATIPHYNYMLEGESIPSAPLLMGGRPFSLLAISQTQALLDNGVMDSTDAIDPAVTLQNLYIKVGADTLKFNVENLPLAVFAAATQGNARQMNLNFKTTSLMINNATKRYDGVTMTGALLGAVTSNLIVRLAVTVNGSVNLELGDTEIYANGLRVESVTDSSGNLLDLTQAPAAAIVAAVAAVSNTGTIGYDLKAFRTNSNRRQRGQLLDTSYYTQMYAVPLRSPITVPRPVTTDGSTDSSDLAALITATHVRTSNAAVGALFTAANVLSDYNDARDTAGNGPDVLGVSRFLVKPVYLKTTLDMLTSIDSIASHKRAADIQAVLVSQIRDFAYRMYRDSGYKAAADAMMGGIAKAPTVIIATDPVISRYLMIDGDLRTLGSDFDVRVVSTLDQRMAGQIAVTFGAFDGSADGTPNPLHFGNMAWKPELTVVMPISRGGQVSKELTVQPSFLHVVNLPVLGWITVNNIPSVVASKVPVNTHEVV